MGLMDSLRQTGRTTRMLDEAEKLAESGRAVYVIAGTEGDARRLKDVFGAEKGEKLGVKFEWPASLGRFNWKTLRPDGAHPNCIFLVDHWVIERQYRYALEMLHRYDS